MISFKEFLSSQENRLRAEQIAQAQAKDRWVSSVVALIEQIEKWIEDSDPSHLVTLKHNFDRNDPSAMDVHVDARLDIWLGNRKVSIKPLVMDVLGPRWKPGEGRWAGRLHRKLRTE